MNRASAVLSVNALSVGYKEKTILNDLNFKIKEGWFVSLLGPNGAGKTTLLRTLSRHLSPVEGVVYIDQKNLQQVPQGELAKIMSVVLTEKVAPPLFRVYDFVGLGRYPHTDWMGKLTDLDKNKVMECLSLVHAEDLVFRDLNTLSDGERQKVLIARALAQEPRVILLDEPTMHLDLKHRMEVMTILQSLCQEKGISVIASLHDVDIAAKISDRVALIKNSTVAAWGTPENVITDEAVADLYGFKGACFNRLLGGIEIKGNGKNGDVFVVSGMGSSPILYRLLSKRGFTISTGILHENDLDYFVADSLGAMCFTESPMAPFSPEKMSAAEGQMKKATCVIDAGFTVGPLNQGNIDLLKSAMKLQKPVYSLRKNCDRVYGQEIPENAFTFCSDESHLVKMIEQEGKRI